MGCKSSVLFVLLLASSSVYSATQSERATSFAPKNTALFAEVHNQSGGDHFEFIAISFLVIAALSFVRRTNSSHTSSKALVKTNYSSQRAAPCGNPKANVHLA